MSLLSKVGVWRRSAAVHGSGRRGLLLIVLAAMG
jgi:hypothetical protein